MSTLQGLVDYPGLNGQFTKAEYTLSAGISPGTVTIEMPQEIVDNLLPSGDVTFSYGDDSFTLPNCVVESVHIDRSLGGYIARVFIKDRRYWWTKTAYLSGHYNLRMPAGPNANEGFNSAVTQADSDATTIRPGTEMAPQDLATLCLEQMGEQNYDVSALPNDSRPEVDWSLINPAEALQQLCEGLGCRVTYVVDSDSVTIVTIGQGNDLPNNGQQEFVSVGAQPPQMPSQIDLNGGPTIFQGYILLEAVGVDTNGQILPINKLSYAPQDGWIHAEPQWAEFTDPIVRPLVDKIYKMWRLTLPIQVPGNNPPPVTDIRQIKLYDRLIDTWADPNDSGKQIPKKPELWGNFDSRNGQTVKTQTTLAEPYRQLTVDADRWLIFTEDQLYQHQDACYQPASIGVLICYSVRDPKTWEPIRYLRQRNLQSGNNTQPQLVHREEIFVKYRGIFQSWQNQNGVPQFMLTGSTDNIASDNIDQEADYYLDAAQNEYIEIDALDVPYAGIVPIQVDGLIHQVTYSIVCPGESGSGGKTETRASLAMEHNPYVLPWSARRRIEERRRYERAYGMLGKTDGSTFWTRQSNGF